MTAADFPRVWKVCGVYEGGFANRPLKDDPGGVTLEGVTQRTDNAWRQRKGMPIRALTPELRYTQEWNAERDAIYRAQFWNAIRGDDLPEGVNLVMFDGCIHSGPYQPVIWLQRALRMNDCDGHLGEATMAALESHPDHAQLVADICARRLGFLQHLNNWNANKNGWSKRVANVKQIGMAWANEEHHLAPAPLPVHEENGNAKAYASDVAQPAIDAGDATKAAAGGGSTGAILQSTKDTIEPLVYQSDVMMKIYTALTIALVVLALGASFYAIWAHYKTRRAQRAIGGEIVADVPDGVPA